MRALQFAVALTIGAATTAHAQQLAAPQQPSVRLLILPFMASPADSATSIAVAVQGFPSPLSDVISLRAFLDAAQEVPMTAGNGGADRFRKAFVLVLTIAQMFLTRRNTSRSHPNSV